MKARTLHILAGIATGVLAQALAVPAVAQTSPANQPVPATTTPSADDPTSQP